MEKLLIILLLQIFSCNENTCNIEKRLIYRSLSAIYEKGILNTDSGYIYVTMPENYKDIFPYGEEIVLGDKQVLVKEYTQGKKYIFFDIFKPYDPEKNELEISFKSRDNGITRYWGRIIFECEKEKLVFKDMNYGTIIE